MVDFGEFRHVIKLVQVVVKCHMYRVMDHINYLRIISLEEVFLSSLGGSFL